MGERKPVYHRKCYRVDIEGKEIAQGVNIQDAKRRAVNYIKRHSIKNPNLKIYYLDTVSGDIEVDNNIDMYIND